MTRKKTALICISDTYLSRGRLLASLYKEQGDDVRILTPDFSHKTKSPITTEEEGVILLKHRPYQSNLSWQRLLGHMEFSRRSREYLEDWQPDRIHCLVPANSLCLEMARYKKHHPEVRLFFDINDLWPESLPVGGWFLKTPPAWIWRRMRNQNLPAADQLFAECALFKDEIHRQTGLDSDILYWAGEEDGRVAHPKLDGHQIDLCYLGFVNNIIDLDALEALFADLNRTHAVRLHLIAQGQRKEEMVERLSPYAKIVDYGAVYDPQKKQAIFDQCAFGINIMKKDVKAGLSMKTLEYLQGSLPVINSLEGDVWNWIEQDGCGINFDRNNPQKTADTILSLDQEQLMDMRKAARRVFERDLSLEAFKKAFENAQSRSA